MYILSKNAPNVQVWGFWLLKTFKNFKIFRESIKIDCFSTKKSGTIFTFEQLRATRSLSATNSMYCFIKVWFMPISLTGRASVRNSCSMTTASWIIDLMTFSDGLLTKYENIIQAKSQWRPWKRKSHSRSILGVFHDWTNFFQRIA